VHELGLLRSVVAAVEKVAHDAGATAVEAVGLRVGTLSGAVPVALHGSWPLATAGTVVAGARLDLDMVTAAVWCATCDAEQPVDEFFALECPVCATPTAQLVRGRELTVTYAELDVPGSHS